MAGLILAGIGKGIADASSTLGGFMFKANEERSLAQQRAIERAELQRERALERAELQRERLDAAAQLQQDRLAAAAQAQHLNNELRRELRGEGRSGESGGNLAAIQEGGPLEATIARNLGISVPVLRALRKSNETGDLRFFIDAISPPRASPAGRGWDGLGESEPLLPQREETEFNAYQKGKKPNGGTNGNAEIFSVPKDEEGIVRRALPPEETPTFTGPTVKRVDIPEDKQGSEGYAAEVAAKVAQHSEQQNAGQTYFDSAALFPRREQKPENPATEEPKTPAKVPNNKTSAYFPVGNASETVKREDYPTGDDFTRLYYQKLQKLGEIEERYVFSKSYDDLTKGKGNLFAQAAGQAALENPLDAARQGQAVSVMHGRGWVGGDSNVTRDEFTGQTNVTPVGESKIKLDRAKEENQRAQAGAAGRTNRQEIRTADLERQINAALNRLAIELGVAKNNVNDRLATLRRRAESGDKKAQEILDRIAPLLEDYDKAKIEMMRYGQSEPGTLPPPGAGGNTNARASPQPPTGTPTVIPQPAIEMLIKMLNDPTQKAKAKEQFDEVFGAGAANRVLGK